MIVTECSPLRHDPGGDANRSAVVVRLLRRHTDGRKRQEQKGECQLAAALSSRPMMASTAECVDAHQSGSWQVMTQAQQLSRPGLLEIVPAPARMIAPSRPSSAAAWPSARARRWSSSAIPTARLGEALRDAGPRPAPTRPDRAAAARRATGRAAASRRRRARRRRRLHRARPAVALATRGAQGGDRGRRPRRDAARRHRRTCSPA